MTTTSLDEAWTEVEAALPEGWTVRIRACKEDRQGTDWHVSAGEDLSRNVAPRIYVEGSPVAALLALAVRLRADR